MNGIQMLSIIAEKQFNQGFSVGLAFQINIRMAFLFFTAIYVNNVVGIFIDCGFYSRTPFFHTK